jgi:two-component system, chemotaxis family, CheB/CheR fusion protein
VDRGSTAFETGFGELSASSQNAEATATPPHSPQPLPTDVLLAAIVASSDDAICSKTLDGVITSWNGAAERLFGYTTAEAVGRHVAMLAAPGREEEMARILAQIRMGEKIDHYDTVRRRKDGSLIEISLTVSPIRDATGRIIGASKIARDISERKHWESRQELLLRELNHRVKNTLAVIQSIARNTARPGIGIDQFIDIFEGRLGAMAAAHDQLVAGNWQSAVLDDLVRGALGAHVAAPGMQLHLPPVHLSPSLAANLALAVHELASNAAKYGALSTPLGRVVLEGSVVGDELSLFWCEHGGPEVRPPDRRGFGTALLADVMTRQHGARVSLDWRREGLVCTLTLPLGSAADRPAG